MTYNLTGMANTTGMLGITQSINSELMFNFFGIMMLLIIYVILILTFVHRTEDGHKSLLAASFICFGLSIMLRGLQLVPDIVVWVLLIISGVIVAIPRR